MGDRPRLPLCFWANFPSKIVGLAWVKEVWARHEQERLEVGSSREKPRPLAVGPAPPTETGAVHHAGLAESGPSFRFLKLLPLLLTFLLRLRTLTKQRLQLLLSFHSVVGIAHIFWCLYSWTFRGCLKMFHMLNLWPDLLSGPWEKSSPFSIYQPFSSGRLSLVFSQNFDF